MPKKRRSKEKMENANNSYREQESAISPPLSQQEMEFSQELEQHEPDYEYFHRNQTYTKVKQQRLHKHKLLLNRGLDNMSANNSQEIINEQAVQ